MKSLAVAFGVTWGCVVSALPSVAGLKAGATVVDVTPPKFPVLVNGGMLSRSVDQVHTQVNARTIVLDDGDEQIAIVVVDSCMMPRPLLDEAKQLVAARTGIRADHMLISATHTHSAPASMGCLGTDADPDYVPYLREKLVEAITTAQKNLEPARIGWGVADAADYTALRRWIRRPDLIADDPFGNPTVRANMHAGRVWDDAVGESGPEDPELSMLAIQSADGRPIAVLANFSMHYFGDAAIGADYFGLFSEGLRERIQPEGTEDAPAFVGIMSHGCSGDIWRRDYTVPSDQRNDAIKIDEYTAGLLDIAMSAYTGIEYQSDADLDMAEARMQMKYRVPDKQRLQWAEGVVAEMGDRLPKTTEEVYAREQIILHERQSTEIVVQALRIGDVAIATTPNETYALTGLKIKHQSPLARTMVIELANGGDGYIPPPEQHLLGGYNTWPARSAGLEVTAEPRIVETALELLEQVADGPRREHRQSLGSAAEATLKLNPVAYWRLDEFAGPTAIDATGDGHDAVYEPQMAYFLEGPRSDLLCEGGEVNRSVHFAGDRLRARLPQLEEDYTVSFWFWNGLPLSTRPVAGWMFSRGHDFGLSPHGQNLGLGGTLHGGKLMLLSGSEDDAALAGTTEIQRWTWYHVTLVRSADSVRVHLNGSPTPEIETSVAAGHSPTSSTFFFGGRSDRQSNWEGRLDEIAVFDRALTPEEIGHLLQK